MNDRDKSKDQLIRELELFRARMAEDEGAKLADEAGFDEGFRKILRAPPRYETVKSQVFRRWERLQSERYDETPQIAGGL